MSARETKKQHTEEKAVHKVKAAERTAMEKYLARLEAKPSARFRVSKDGSNWQIGFDHPDQLVGRALVMGVDLRHSPFDTWAGRRPFWNNVLNRTPRWFQEDAMSFPLAANQSQRDELFQRMGRLINPYPSFGLILGLAVGIWIGGFDLIYACQDIETDREIGVMSVPARFGIPASIWGARVCHALTTALLAWYGAATGAGAFFWFGLLIVAGAFLYEHSIVRPHDLSRLNRAFFSVNGFIGIALFVCALLDLLVRGLTV